MGPSERRVSLGPTGGVLFGYVCSVVLHYEQYAAHSRQSVALLVLDLHVCSLSL